MKIRWYQSLTLRLLLLFWALLLVVATSGYFLAIWYSKPETASPLAVEVQEALTPLLSDPDTFSSLTPGRLLAGNYRVAAAVAPEAGPNRLQLEPNLANTYGRRLLEQLQAESPEQLRIGNNMLLGPFELEGQRILLTRPLTEAEQEQQLLSDQQEQDSQTLALFFGSLSIAILLVVWLVRPIRRLTKATQEIGEGAENLKLKRLPKRSDEIGELARALESAAHDLAVSRDAQRRLLSDVSHELRSPLARMQVALMLSQDDIDDDDNPHFAQMSRDVDRLGTIIERILSLSRLENGLVKLQPKTIDTYALAQTLAADLSYVNAEFGERVEVLEGDWATTGSDEELLRLVLENLVRNALQYSPNQVAMSCEQSTTSFTIKVRDYGNGVPEDQLAQLFEPFFRGDPSRHHNAGVGLGMALSLRAANVLGGSVTARNHPEGGLEVSIHMPLNDVVVDKDEELSADVSS